MIELYTAQQSQAIDHYAIQQKKIPGLLLMKRAGLFSYETLLSHYPNAQKLLIVCGTGNNGGDGFVVAQLALMAGIEVTLVLSGEIETLKNDALSVYQEVAQLGMELSAFPQDSLNDYDLIIDALFGTGLDRDVSGEIANWINLINATNTPVLSLDIASGLDANTGRVLGTAIRAERTCTFLTHKPGLYQFNGTDYCGKIHYHALCLESETLHTQTPVALNHPLKHWLNQLPQRPESSHKGSTGSVCLIGGDQHMMGAIQMAGLASLKVGAGLVKVITHAEHGIALTQVLPELMCYSPKELEQQITHTTVIAIGPGLGLTEWAKALFSTVIHHPQPKVLDADALTLLAKSAQQQANWVLTPHPGEAARLLNTTTEAIQQDRIAAVKAIQKQYGGVVVLKGNASLIYDGQQLEMCLAGNPGMATGGMGDVLTGTISGLIAQGMPLFEAACLGVNLHAHAGDIIAQQKGQNGLLPTELASTLSQLMTYANR